MVCEMPRKSLRCYPCLLRLSRRFCERYNQSERLFCVNCDISQYFCIYMYLASGRRSWRNCLFRGNQLFDASLPRPGGGLSAADSSRRGRYGEHVALECCPPVAPASNHHGCRLAHFILGLKVI